MTTLFKCLIAQDNYNLIPNKNGAMLNKTGKLAVQRISNEGKVNTNDLISKGYRLNPENNCWEREKIGGVIEDNIGEVLGFVYEPGKYDENLKRKPEHFIKYDWSRTS